MLKRGYVGIYQMGDVLRGMIGSIRTKVHEVPQDQP